MGRDHLILLLLLAACAAPVARRDERRVPRGWTLDTSEQDIRAVNVREQKAFGEGKVIRADDFSAESLTTEATLSSADGKKQIEHLSQEFNKLLCINQALKEAIEVLEDQRCFATLKAVEELEVHVSTSVSAMRKADKWPEFKVELGGSDDGEFAWASALDGGTVVFRKMFPVKKKDGKVHDYYNMEEILQGIKLVLNSEDRTNYINDYVEFKESFGGTFCAERRWGSVFGCKKGKTLTMKKNFSVETNRLHIDRVEIYMYFADDDRPYKVFASHSSRREPLVILDNIVRSYSVAGFKNNPHWLLHYYSAACDMWQKDHDGSEFGQYIWNKYIKQKNNSSINIYASPLRCAGVGAVPAEVAPEIPEINTSDKSLDLDDINQWLNDNKDRFKPHVNSSKAACQPRTAAVIMTEAIEQKKCGKEPQPPLAVPEDLDSWSATRLSRGATYLEGKNNDYKISNEGLVTDINNITGSGCFYEKKLLGGIKVKISGQMLVNVGGKLMTRRQANECIFKSTTDGLAVEDGNYVYINLGFNTQSYPIITHNSGVQEDGRFAIDAGLILDTYTKNFNLQDIRFVHLEKTAHEMFFTHEDLDSATHDRIWSPPWGGRVDPTVTTASVLVEQGIVALSSIELIFDGDVIYQRGSPPPPRAEGEEAGEIDCNEDKAEVLDALFVLTSSSNVWMDYNVHGNDAWDKYRDEKDHHCVEEE